jgi:hypothetical protein
VLAEEYGSLPNLQTGNKSKRFIPTIIHPGQTRPIFFVYLNISLLVVSIPTR